MKRYILEEGGEGGEGVIEKGLNLTGGILRLRMEFASGVDDRTIKLRGALLICPKR